MDKAISKLTSGRWFLTIVSGLVFAYATYAKVLPPEAVASIITMVFISYFQRKRSEEGGELNAVDKSNH